ncbi:MAG: InlB B-repeat-containing protein, partial [Treponema sp.]|nr:InlB B-repeat-containing protein [Treponema sp.]
MKLFFSDVKKIFTVVLGILCIFSCKMEVSGGGSESGAGSDNPESPTVVEYSIRHFVESLDGGWTELTDDRGTGQGNIASTTKYGPSDAKSYSGFSFKEVKNTDLAADGSSVVEFYYTRNTYTLTFDAGEGVFSGMGADGEDVSTLSVEFKYGQQIVPPTPTRQGYSAVWADSNTCPAENATYTVTWLEGNATLYTIRHLLESLDGEWNERIDDRSSAQGTTASTTELTESDAKSYEGFYFKEVKNTDIAADGSSEVSFYYIRNSYTLTFDAGEGTFADGKKSVTKSFKYGETVVAPTATRQGYSASWSTGDCPSENASYTVTWVPNENTSYHITHFVEMLDGSWSEKSGDRSTGRGKTDGLTTLSESDAKSYPGFTFKEVKNVKIKADGTSLVEFHYARNSYTLTFNAGEGEFDGGAKTVTRTLKYEAPVEIPTATRQGYTASWASVPGKCPSENASYTVTWIEGNATGYSIKHFVEDLNGGWTERTGDSGTGLGKTGAMTTCSESGAKSYQGFSFKEVKNVSIAADGSSVVGFYYSCDTYTLTFNAGEGEFDGGAKTVSRTFKYEALVEIPSARRTGYSEIWTGVPNVCPAENATYTATWKASENTPYKIKHFLMNVDGRTWDERTSDESTGHGTTDAQTALTKSNAKSYMGFVFYEVKNTTIAADGSSVVEFYYRRNYYTITFVAEGGTFETGTTVSSDGNATVNVIYGGTVTAPNVTRPGYEVSWPEFETCTGAKIYTAMWKACDVDYTVEYWKQNADDDEYVMHSSKSLTGKPGEKTKATKINISGFELREPLAQQQVEIVADGSTV